MINIKKAAIIAAIAILFAAFIFSLITAVYEEPQYSRFCYEDKFAQPRIISATDCPDISFSEEEAKACNDQGFTYTPKYDGNGCVTNYDCQTCSYEYEQAREDYKSFRFIVATILGLIAVIASIYLPYKSNSLKEWLLSGFLIGGLAAIFIATIEYFGDASRILKPIILFLEMILIIFIAFKKIKHKK